MLAHGLDPGQQLRLAGAFRRRGGLAHDLRAADPILERAQTPRGPGLLGRAGAEQVEEPDVAGVVGRAAVELAVQHDPGADPLAPVDHHQGVLAPVRVAPPLALRGQLDVVVQVDGAAERLGQPADEEVAGQAGHARDELDDPGRRVDDTGGADRGEP